MNQEILQTPFGEIEIKRRKGRRRISIVMHPRKPIEVRTNLKVPHREILKFLLEKKNWIEKNMHLFREQQQKFPDFSFDHDQIVPLFGKPFKIALIPTVLRSSIQVTGSFIEIRLNSKDMAVDRKRHLVRELYKKVSINYLQQRVEAISLRMKSFPVRLSFGEAQGLWGSCHRSGHIRLNWKLIVFDPGIIDYVVIHELAHLTHLNHSAHFWEQVEKYCPQYKEAREYLKKNSSAPFFLEKRR